MSGSTILLRGDDHTLLVDELRARVASLVGDDDRALLVDEFEGDEYELAALVRAARTPPFLSDRRIVVGRSVERFATADAVAPLVDYLGDPCPTSTVLLTWVGGRVPRRLSDALKRTGAEVVTAGAPSGARARREWWDQHLASAAVVLDPAARSLLVERLGEDVGRLGATLTTLEATFGPGAELTVDDIAGLVGSAGSVPPWELTDAIDRGDIAGAIDRLHRMLDAGDRHELVIMAILTTHYTRMLRLDGAEFAGDKGAAEIVGAAPFTARKLVGQLRRLGSGRLGESVVLLGEADVDLRGRTAVAGRTILEVLVARLARLAR